MTVVGQPSCLVLICICMDFALLSGNAWYEGSRRGRSWILLPLDSADPLDLCGFNLRLAGLGLLNLVGRNNLKLKLVLPRSNLVPHQAGPVPGADLLGDQRQRKHDRRGLGILQPGREQARAAQLQVPCKLEF